MLKIKKSKKGISLMIAYLLLVSMGIVLSIFVYNYLKTYVPKEPPQCPDGVSIFIQNTSCDGSLLNITLKNNGRFYIAGYYVYIGNDPSKKIADISLADKIVKGGHAYGGAIVYAGPSENPFSVDSKKFNSFDISSINPSPLFIEIIPTRVDYVDNKKMFLICSHAKIKETLNCP